MIDFQLSFALVFILFVWLRTNAIVDFFGSYLKKWNFYYIGDYIELPEVVKSSIWFPLWVYSQHPSLLTYLLSCPLCSSFWTNILFGIVFLFSPFSILANATVTLITFCLLDKLYKHGK